MGVQDPGVTCLYHCLGLTEGGALSHPGHRNGARTWAPLLPPKVTLCFPVFVFMCFPLQPQTPGQENCFIFNLHVPISGPSAWHNIGTQEMFVKQTNKCCLGLECPLLEEESMAVSWILIGIVDLEGGVLAPWFLAA